MVPSCCLPGQLSPHQGPAPPGSLPVLPGSAHPLPAGCANECLPGPAGAPEPGGQCDLCATCIPATVLCSHRILGVPGRAPPAAAWACCEPSLAMGSLPLCRGPSPASRRPRSCPCLGVLDGGQATSGLSVYSDLLFLREAKPASKEWQLLPWGETVSAMASSRGNVGQPCIPLRPGAPCIALRLSPLQ